MPETVVSSTPARPAAVTPPKSYSTGAARADIQPALTMLPARLVAARQNMLGTGFYLGTNSFRDRVHWVRDGRANRLAIKRSEPADDLQSASPADDGSSEYPTPPPEELEIAPICAAVKISDRDYWLTPDGGFRGPSDICKDFSEIKGSCAAEQPEVTPFKEDYSTVIDNMRWLQAKTATPGFAGRKGLFLQANPTGLRFKVRHKYFEQRDPEVEKAETASGDASLDDGKKEGQGEQDNNEDEDDESAVFMIQNWPTYHDAAASGLEAIKETHQVIPVPAYGTDGKLIKPQNYRRQLEGALVELYFGLSHWSIAGKKGAPGNDVYSAEIIMIRVLAAPQAMVAGTPRKRKALSLYVDPNAPPTKKMRRS